MSNNLMDEPNYLSLFLSEEAATVVVGNYLNNNRLGSNPSGDKDYSQHEHSLWIQPDNWWDD